MHILATIFNVLALSLLCWMCWRWRSVYLLPSTWVLLLSAIFYMLPSLIFSQEIEDVSPYTWDAVFYCSTFVCVGTLINLYGAKKLAHQSEFESAAVPLPIREAMVSGYLKLIILAIGLIMAWYLLVVPLTSTGLYGLLVDPDHYAQLREDSLKLLDNPPLQYAYLIGFSCLSPLAFSLLLERTRLTRGVRCWVPAVLGSLFLCFYILLTGARVGIINFVIIGLLYVFLRNGMRFNWKTLVLGVCVFIVPITLSMMREAGRNDATTLFDYLKAIGDRIFLLPLLISGWYVEFAETRGYVGFLAAMGLNVQPDWTNVIALEFLDRKESVTIESVTTPTSFIFSNYLYLGWLGLVPSLLALRFIDIPILYLRGLPEVLKVPFFITALYFATVFIRAGFGVTVLSHGYIVLIILWKLISVSSGSTHRAGVKNSPYGIQKE